jgi:4-amino-4-deoxy-L-arabinose transferase-like glycosyltransferase
MQQTSAVPETMLEKREHSTRTRIYLGILVLVWLVVYIPGMVHRGLLDDADSVHAEAAREMVLSHDWVTLHADGIRYLEKAPLMYWCVAACYKLFGVTEWSTRLPIALSVLALAWVIFLLGRLAYGELGGFYSALIVETCIGIYLFTRFLIPDVMVTLWLALGLYLFLRGFEQANASRWLWWGFAVTVALNVLTKSLIGLVFPAAAIGLFLILTGNLRYLRKMHLGSGILIFLAVAAPWHILAALRNPPHPPEKGFLWFYFINEQFLRYLNERIPHDYGKVPLVLFWGLLLVFLFPWSAFLLQALRRIPYRLKSFASGLDAVGRANLLFALWAGFIMVFFSFSSRQEYYSLPALPALALLIGGWLARESASEPGSPPRRTAQVSSWILLAIGVTAFVVTMALVALSKPVPPGTDIADLLTQHPKDYVLSMGHVLDLTLSAFGAFHGPLLGTGLAFLAGTALNWYFRRRGSPFRGNLALGGMMVVFLLCVNSGLRIFEPVISSKRLALDINKVYQPGDIIVIHGDYEDGSTLNFYTGHQVEILNGREADLWYGSLFPDAPHIFLNNDSFARLWKGPNRVFLFTDLDRESGALRGIDPKTVYPFAREGGKVLLTNRPIGQPSADGKPQ